ncbi:MAG: hypothetical protein IJP03_00680 [Christensenellaceae bacterium]|nr:hypothetical protein [Christensenellaceae bacterium]
MGSYKNRKCIAALLIVLGVLLCMLLLPLWVWSVLLGAVLIVLGLFLLSCC